MFELIWYRTISRYKVLYLKYFRSICTYIFNADDNKKSIVLIVSITSFTLMDVGLEMLGVYINFNDSVYAKYIWKILFTRNNQKPFNITP